MATGTPSAWPASKRLDWMTPAARVVSMSSGTFLDWTLKLPAWSRVSSS